MRGYLSVDLDEINTRPPTPGLNSAVKHCNLEWSVYFNHQFIDIRLSLSRSHCMYFT